jgi:transcriptional regulator with PAS, ATPase and Fis domain
MNGKFNLSGYPAGLLNDSGAVFNYDKVVMDILIHGETGTGKDVVAKHIHAMSGRRGAFVGINCAAIPESLAESQLFGVVKGAFTGASSDRQGYIEASNGGTLYLDEIDSMPLSLQAKFLRILEARGVERLGSTRFIPLDLHIVASTQRSLPDMVEADKFRRDLLFRLNVLTINLPALRHQRERILPLFDQFVNDMPGEMNRRVSAELDGPLTQCLLSHSWPGNIRELKSAAKRFLLGLPLLGNDSYESPPLRVGLKSLLKVSERLLIMDALKRHRHSLERVMEELEIPMRTLYHRMKELSITV